MEASTAKTTRFQWLFLLSIVIVSVNLRPGITSVPPVLEAIQDDIELSYTAISLLTAIPSFCIGIFSLAVPFITNKLGRERGVFWAIILVAIATVVRISSELVFVLFASTIVVGIGIAVAQALLPSLVSEYFSHRESFATGLYTAGLTGGAALASGVTAPISTVTGSWALALSFWALLAIFAIPIWYLCWQEIAATEGYSPALETQANLPWRDSWALFITVYFGLASIVYFFVLTWLVPRYVAFGWGSGTAGLLLMLFFVTQLGGNLFISAVGDRFIDKRPLFVCMTFLIIGGALAVAYLPEVAPLVWVSFLGLGTGGLFTLNLMLPVIYADSATTTDGLSSLMFGGGSLISAFGPLIGGFLRDVTGSFSVAFACTAFVAGFLLVSSVLFNPSRNQITAETTIPVSERS